MDSKSAGIIFDLEQKIADLEASMRQAYDMGFSDGVTRVDSTRIAPIATEPNYLTEGSFGKISVLPLSRTVYKTTILGDKANAAKLEHEFNICCEIHRVFGRYDFNGRDGQFISPEPHGILNPFNRTVKLPSQNAKGPSNAPYVSGIWETFEKPTMALELIPSIPPLIGAAYCSTFFASSLKQSLPDISPRLFRLYLGRELPDEIQELQPGLRSDLALDVSRYGLLSEALEEIATLPRLSDVAYGMGVALCQLHWGVGVDGMDCELVLGGDGVHGVRCYILDYNQCSRWLPKKPFEQLNLLGSGDKNPEELCDGARKLARRIGHCEQYYPRPSHELYTDFKAGYTSTMAQLIKAHRPDDETSLWKSSRTAVIPASEAFFEEYELVHLATLDRKDRGKGRQRRTSPGMQEDTF